MTPRAANVWFNCMESSLTALFDGSIEYNYFAHCLASPPSMTRLCTMAQLRLIIDPSIVPLSFSETLDYWLIILISPVISVSVGLTVFWWKFSEFHLPVRKIPRLATTKIKQFHGSLGRPIDECFSSLNNNKTIFFFAKSVMKHI